MNNNNNNSNDDDDVENEKKKKKHGIYSEKKSKAQKRGCSRVESAVKVVHVE